MNCPVCTTELRVADRQGIEIDHCPRCRGIWLDRGELEKLMERARTHGADSWYDDPPRSRESSDSSRTSDRDESNLRKPQKKESFWGEIFDFD